jgi:hypothetical protein
MGVLLETKAEGATEATIGSKILAAGEEGRKPGTVPVAIPTGKYAIDAINQAILQTLAQQEISEALDLEQHLRAFLSVI